MDGVRKGVVEMMWGSGYGMGWFGIVMMLAVWVLFIVGIVWLVRVLRVQGHGADGARRILDERFATGELSVEDYEARRKALR